MSGLKIDTLRDRRSTNAVFVSTERLYVNGDDEVIAAGEPGAVRLLVGAGGGIPMPVAEAYGLVSTTDPSVSVAGQGRATFDAEADARRGTEDKGREGLEDKGEDAEADEDASESGEGADGDESAADDAVDAEAIAAILAGTNADVAAAVASEGDAGLLEAALEVETRKGAREAIAARLDEIAA